MPRFSLALITVTLVVTSLVGCTTNTYPDGRRETVWGAPQDTGNDAYRPGTIRDETGEVRGQTELPED
ncbi:hypothetical protein [Litchfieldella xinjiangensis]|uniref:hypothetical protein n=1 Tax=Litchfieldella xinjiangensis TaxID=1166948 RepID=UPI0005BDB348|nr:hypothetical protein [Halomonas xinjiangensis]